MANLLAPASGPAFALLPAATGAPVQPALRGQTHFQQKIDSATHTFGAACGVVGVTAVVGMLASSATKRQTAVRPSGRSIAVKAAQGGFRPEAQLGVQAPVQFWDPLGLASDNNEETFNRRRRVELKHGRVSMLAVIGYIVPEYYRFPGYLSPSENLKFEDVPNGLAALSKVPVAGWAQYFIFCGLCEFYFLKQEKAPGDYGLGFLGAWNLLGSIKDPKVRATKLNAELANGRLAMFAIMSLFFQNGVTGSTGGELYGWGEGSGLVYGQVLLPGLLALAVGGEVFRNGPDSEFAKRLKLKEFYGAPSKGGKV